MLELLNGNLINFCFQSHSIAVEPVTIGHIIQSELRLPAPDIEKHHSRTIQAGAGEVGVVSLEVENYIQCGSGYLHKLKLLKAGDTEWEQVLSSKVIATVGTRRVLIVSE